MPITDRTHRKYFSITKLGKIKTKEGDRVIEGDVYSGHIRGVEYKEDEYQEDKIHKVLFIFRDAHGSEEVLQCGLLSSAGKSIMNTIAGTPNPDHLEIAPHIKEFNGKKFVNVYIKVNGDKGEWKYSPRDDFPKAEEIRLPSGKMVKDDANVLPFFIQLAEECNQIVSGLKNPAMGSAPARQDMGSAIYGSGSNPGGSPAIPADQIGKGAKINMDFDDADDDLPF